MAGLPASASVGARAKGSVQAMYIKPVFTIIFHRLLLEANVKYYFGDVDLALRPENKHFMHGG